MEIAGVALRDLILLVSAVAGIYLVLMTLRLMQVGRRKAQAPPIETAVPTLAPSQDESGVAPKADEKKADADEDEAGDDETFVYARPRVVAPEEPPSFGSELARSHLEREVKQLREEIAELRGELANMKAASRVSPQYADAMALAQRGLTAQDVADRCNISLAEAELVWALARGPQNLDQEENYGGEPGSHHTRSA